MPPPTIVSVTTPVSQAINRVQRLLFQPFDMGRWFTIGFCAWLAQLGEAGFNANFNFGSHNDAGSMKGDFHRAWSYVMDNLVWIIPLAIGLIVLCLALWAVMLWLSSRGRFMFLHCVVLEKAEIDVPWRNFRRAGNSLFWFRLGLGLAGLVPILPLLAVAIALVVPMVKAGTPNVPGILMLVVIVLLLVLVSTIFFVIGKLTTDFVVPLMSLRGGSCSDSWLELLRLMAVNVGNFAVYLLFQVVLAMATGMLVLLVVLVTCCIAGCLMIIPYLGAVVLLPISVFKRSYSLHFLAQFGRECDLFPPPVNRV